MVLACRVYGFHRSDFVKREGIIHSNRKGTKSGHKSQHKPVQKASLEGLKECQLKVFSFFLLLLLLFCLTKA
jgi:hypothetical protein